MNRMTGTAVAAVLTLGLGACGGGKTVTAENASVAEVAQKVKEADIAEEGFISPGQWKMTMTITDMTMPGIPPEAAAKMKEQMGQSTRSFETCVTPEQAKKPKEDFFAGDDAGNCRYEHFSMGKGVINMVMHCAEQNVKRTVRMNGTYGGDSYHMNIESSGEGAGKAPMAGVSMKAVMDAKRIGTCTGKEG